MAGLLRSLLPVLLIALASGSRAQVCDPRSSQSQIAREDLHRAAVDGDFPTAQDYADRGRREMDQLTVSADRCACPAARAYFEAASKLARESLEVDNRRDLRLLVGQAERAFEEAMTRLKECSRR